MQGNTDAVKISPILSIFSSVTEWTENCICPLYDLTEIVGDARLRNRMVSTAMTTVWIKISEATIQRGGRKKVVDFDITSKM